MSILVIGTVRVDPAKLLNATAQMQAMLIASRAEDGCISYAYAEDVLEPGLIRVTEVWRDREALHLHFKTPHMAEWRAAWPDIGIHDRQLKLFEAGEPEAI